MPTPKENNRARSKSACPTSDLARAIRILHSRLADSREQHSLGSLGMFGSSARRTAGTR